MDDDSLLELIAEAVVEVGRIIGTFDAADWSRPTPCPEFDVRAVVGHLVESLAQYADLAHARPLNEGLSVRVAPSRARATYLATARSTVAAWRETGVSGERRMPWGTASAGDLVGYLLLEQVGHGWDLARATSRSVWFSDRVVARAFDIARGYDDRTMRGPGMFGPPAAVPAGSGAVDRLAGFLGRRP